MGSQFKNSKTFFLFAKPSFLTGMARLLDFSGSLNTYNQHPTGDEADRAAILRDWWAVGDDMRWAVRRVEVSPEMQEVKS